MRSLTFRLLLVGLLLTAGIRARAGLVLNVFYDEIGGTAVADLTGAAHFPTGPNPTIGGLAASLLIDELDYQPNQSGDGVNDYGTHVRAFLYPPMDGDYRFFIASDDASELQLSSDTTVGNLSTVAFESGCCTALFSGDRLEERRSDSIPLSRGQIYYFEFFHKEGGGGDWYTIGWEKPDGTREIIPTWYVEPFPLNEDGSNLQPQTGIAPEFPAQYFPNQFFPNNVPNSGHPENVTATEFRSATFGAAVLAEPAASFQWQISTDGGSSWSDIDGAILPAHTIPEVSLDDDGNQYRVVASNSEGEVTSNAATLSVTPDTTPPEVTGVEVGIIDPNVLTLTFSEGLEESSAEDPANYSLNNDATVQSAALQGDGITVIVTAEGIVDSQSGYELSVSGVRDRASSPNTMAPATFPLVLFPGGLVQDANGFVVFEAENFDENVGDFWVEDTERGNPSGGVSMVVPNGQGGGEASAQLLYHVNFGQSGRHIVWYSASGNDGSDDSAWLHIDGERPPERASDNDAAMTGFSGEEDFIWLSDSFDGADPMDFTLETSGLHTVGLAQREDGSFFDKFIITTDETYDPTVDNDGFNREETRSAGEPLPNPEINVLMQPEDQTAFIGRPATFEADAEAFTDGEPASGLLYSWAVNGQDIPGSGGNIFTTPPVTEADDGSEYQVVVRMAGLRVVSDPATLTVIPIEIAGQSPSHGETDVIVDLSEISISLADGPEQTIDTEALSMTLNGEDVPITTEESDGVITVTHAVDGLLPGDSTIEVALMIETVEGGSFTYETSFETESTPVLVPGGWASSLGSGSEPGFRVRSVQAAEGTGLANNIDRAEAQLADPPQPAAEHEGTDTPLVINYNQDAGGAAGVFDNDTGMQDVGLMGSHTDEISMEILTFLEFEEAGVYRMGVNTDDGFMATVSRLEGDDPFDASVRVGAHDGGGGATSENPQYPFKFLIEKPGVYAFRMTWWEGSGGANIEWQVKDQDGVAHLVNGEGSPVSAFQTRTEEPPPGPEVSIAGLEPGATFEAGSDVTLTADVTSTGSPITVVEFFANGEKIGEATSEPYEFVWENPPDGRYNITIRASDETLAFQETDPIEIVVGNPPPEVLLVVSSGGANASDMAIAADLEAKGFVVQTIGATPSQASDSAGKVLVVISSTVSSGDVTDKFQDVAVPVINWEQALQDDFLQTLDDGSVRGTLADQTSLEIVDADHPLAAELAAGVHEVVTEPSTFSWGTPGESVEAQIVATVDGTPDQAVIYVVEQGGALIDGSSAAEKRIHFFFGDVEFLVTTAEGKALWDAAVEYAVGELPEPPTDGPELSISADGATVTISWDPTGGTLQSAPAVTGPWSDIAGASSPHSADTDADATYFRVVQ